MHQITIKLIMKKTVKSILYILLATAFVVSSCKKKTDDPAPSTGGNTNLEIIEGEISSDKILDASKKYLLKAAEKGRLRKLKL